MSEKDYQEILHDLPRRRKVWTAIVELAFDRPDMDYVLCTCRESGYSWAELDRIARYEAAPVIWFTWEEFQFVFMPHYDYLMSYLFDSDWVAGKILKRVRRRHHALTVKLFGHRMMRSLEEGWREVERRFKAGDYGAGGGAVARNSPSTN
jgi:hypothetical protein